MGVMISTISANTHNIFQLFGALQNGHNETLLLIVIMLNNSNFVIFKTHRGINNTYLKLVNPIV